MGTAVASAGAAGPSEGLRAGRSSGRTKQEYTASSGRRDHATYRSGLTHLSDERGSEPDYLLRPTRHGPGGTLLIIEHSLLAHKSPFRRLGLEAILGAQRLLWKDTLRFESAINRSSGFGRFLPPLPTFRVRYTRALQQSRGV